MPKDFLIIEEFYTVDRKTKTFLLKDTRYNNENVAIIKWDSETYGYSMETLGSIVNIPMQGLQLVVDTINAVNDGTYSDGLIDF